MKNKIERNFVFIFNLIISFFNEIICAMIFFLFPHRKKPMMVNV